MDTEKLWKTVEKVVFVAELIAKIGYQVYVLEGLAENFRIGIGDNCGKLKYDYANFEYEIDDQIGTFRFRDKRFGPWTQWRPIET